MSLTDRALKNAKPKQTVYRIRDTSADPELKGFGVTIAPVGSKTFFLISPKARNSAPPSQQRPCNKSLPHQARASVTSMTPQWPKFMPAMPG